MASPVRKLIYYGIIEHLKLILRGFNVILLVLTRSKSTVKSRDLTSAKKHRVAIIGASFAGCKVEQFLSNHPDHFDIVWIDEKEYFEYIPGSLRCFVEPNHFRSISCELRGLSSNFVNGKVTDIPTETSLRLANNDTIAFDTLVVCAGSTYADAIVKTTTTKSSIDRLASYNAESRKIRSAKTIIIIGAGAVGVELATEILTKRGQQRRIVLVDTAATILPGFPESSIQYATKHLEKHQVEIHLNTKLREIAETHICFEDGTKLSADIVYRCIGAKPNTAFLHNSILKDALKGPKQAVAVNDLLQVEAFPHIYCAGDIMHHAKSDEIKLGHTAEVNASFVAERLIDQVVHGSTSEGSYPMSVVGNVATPFIYCISLGKYDGTLGFNGFVVNGFVAAVLKWIIEWTKVAAVRKQPIGIFFWQFGDFVSNFIGRTIIPTKVKN